MSVIYKRNEYINILKNIQEILSLCISEYRFNRKTKYLDIINDIEDYYTVLHMLIFANNLDVNITIEDALFRVEEILRVYC